MKFHLSLFCTLFGVGTVLHSQTTTDLPAPPAGTAKKATLKGFKVSGQIGTARTTTVPGFKVAGHTGTRTASAKQQTAQQKSVITDNRPLPAPSKRKNVTYADDIRPIFQINCFACHGENNQMGDLRLDTLESTLKGTKLNTVIVPGKSRQSSLITAIAQLDDDSAMPPGNRTPLTSKQIGLIRAWIIQGAK